MRYLTNIAIVGAILASATQVSPRDCPTVVGHSSNVALFRAVEVDGDYAYIADEHTGLWICDVARPSDPVFVGNEFISEGAIDLAVSGSFVYSTGGRQLQIVNVTDPTIPALTGHLQLKDEAVDLELAGDLVFVGYRRPADDGYVGGFAVVDVSDRTRPREIAVVDFEGEPFALAFSEGHLVLTSTSGMRIYDVSSPSSPYLVSHSDFEGTDIAISGDHAYLAGSGYALLILDISQPAAPTTTSRFSVRPAWTTGVTVSGDLAYLMWEDRSGSVGGQTNGGFEILDVSNPETPINASSLSGRVAVGDIAASGSYAYSILNFTDFSVIDMSTVTQPVEIAVLRPKSRWARKLAIDAKRMFVSASSSVSAYDISDFNHPVELGYYQKSESSGTHDIGVLEALPRSVYVADGDSLEVVQFAPPDSPTVVHQNDSGGRIEGLSVLEDTAYLAVSGFGLRIVSCCDGGLTELGSLEFSSGDGETVGEIAVSDGYAFVASYHGDDDRFLRLIDVSHQSSPVEAASVPCGYVWDIAVSNGIAFLAETYGVRVIDVSTPQDPHELVFLEGENGIRGIEVWNSFLYVLYDAWNSSDEWAVSVFEISDPSHPRLTAQSLYRARATDAIRTGDHLYVAAVQAGLVVIEAEQPCVSPPPRRPSGRRSISR